MSNALLDISSLPKFSKISIKLIEPAIDQVLKENRQQLNDLLNQQDQDLLSWKTLVYPLEVMSNRLSRVWSPVSHLNSVMNSDELRTAHDACIPKLSNYSTELSQNKDLYTAYKNIQQSHEYADFNCAQKKTIENALLQFKLSGVGLSDKDKQQYKKIKQELSTLKTKYEHNVLDATQQWKLSVSDETVLSGLPDYVKAMAKQQAKNEKTKGWLLTLDAPCYLSIMMYADNRDLRKEMYKAFSTRASDQGPDAGKFDNSQIMEDILKHRQSMAKLLGFNNFSELSIADKMADSTTDVLSFLNDLVEKSRHQAIKEIQQLKEFSQQGFGIDDLEAWDIAYFSEKLKQKEYGISQEELKPYFPASKVIAGLFKIVNRLYGIEITQIEDIDVWHSDVLFYEIKDHQGEIRGQFYLDLYTRENKRGGAWMDECVCRMICDGEIQIPVAYLTCNLTPSVGDDPALLTHEEVTTLFHEFGHGLQHMLTKVDHMSVSGISGVEWDAVELPSQFMENWCWEKQGLELISSHYQTQKSLPENLFNKLIKAKNFQSAMSMVRQLEFSLFDFKLHMQYGKQPFKNIQTCLNDVREKVAVVIPPEFNRFQHGFSHIFAGGYSAGYYSYKWAEVLSADAFSKFEQQGIFDKQTGQEFLTKILEKGGSEKAMDLFKNFRGRAPEIDALLRHSGLN